MPATLDFGPYAQILRTLMPRVRGVYLYAPDGDLVWSSEGADYFDLRPAIEELLALGTADAAERGFRRMIDETPAYGFLLRGADARVLAALAVLTRPPTRDGDVPPLDLVEKTVAPLLAIVIREIDRNHEARAAGPAPGPAPAPPASPAPPAAAAPAAPAAARDPVAVPAATAAAPPPGETARVRALAGNPAAPNPGDSMRMFVVPTDAVDVADTQELQWLLDLAHIDAPADGGADGLQALLDAYAVRCDCDVALLHVPGPDLERTVARGAIRPAELDALRALVGRHLFRVAQLQRKTLVVNKVREDGAGGLVPFRILCTPLVRRGHVAGVAVAFRHANGRPFELRDARMLERLAPRLQEILEIRYDDATGLPTRHALEQHVAAAIARRADVRRCVVYADVDQLHVLNDLFGFAAGDEVLRTVGRAWRALPLPPGSGQARLGGDRFVALLEDCTTTRATAWAEEARLAIEALPVPERCTAAKVSASLGVAAVEDSLEHALAAAQTACKAAKDRGRNRVESFTVADPSLMQRHEELKVYRDLMDAFENGRFRLYAQPIVPLWDPTRPARYEILVRMLDAHDQPVAPERFMHAATRYQLLDRLDRWVLWEALRQLRPHATALGAAGATFAVNVSEQSLAQADAADFVREQLAAAGVPATLLAFEIAEGAATARFAEAERFVGAVKALGCQTAIDDFGTGLSSLATLKSLPVAALKLDGVFIRDLLTNPRSESMVRAILQVARQLEIETVAESVETPETASHLATLGVTYGQGWAFAHPRPLREVLEGALRRTARGAPAPVAEPPAASPDPGRPVH